IHPVLMLKSRFRRNAAQPSQGNIIFQICPANAVALSRSRFDLSIHGIGVSEIRQINACVNRQTNPLPDPRIDVQQFEIAAAFIVDKFDLADALIAELLENRNAALDNLFDIARIYQTGGAEIGRVLLQLASDKDAFRLAVAPDIATER